MRVSRAITALMVAPVDGHPGHHAALAGHRTGDGQRGLDRGRGLERAVREQPVVADGNSQTGHHPHHDEQGHFRHPDGVHPEKSDSGRHTEERQNVEQQKVTGLQAM
nr:hypothetical protein [Rhodococcus wratislaviensis]